jgi:hypothetical protein
LSIPIVRDSAGCFAGCESLLAKANDDSVRLGFDEIVLGATPCRSDGEVDNKSSDLVHVFARRFVELLLLLLLLNDDFALLLALEVELAVVGENA